MSKMAAEKDVTDQEEGKTTLSLTVLVACAYFWN